MSQVLLITLGVMFAAALGAGSGYWFGRTRRQREVAKADEIRAEFDDYRRRVTEHFGQTADHFQTIGREYRALYEHMASGAHALCDAKLPAESLPFAPTGLPAAAAAEPPATGEAGAEEERPPADFATGAADASDESMPGVDVTEEHAEQEAPLESGAPPAQDAEEKPPTADELGKAADDIRGEDAEPDEETTERTYH